MRKGSDWKPARECRFRVKAEAAPWVKAGPRPRHCEHHLTAREPHHQGRQTQSYEKMGRCSWQPGLSAGLHGACCTNPSRQKSRRKNSGVPRRAGTALDKQTGSGAPNLEARFLKRPEIGAHRLAGGLCDSLHGERSFSIRPASPARRGTPAPEIETAGFGIQLAKGWVRLRLLKQMERKRHRSQRPGHVRERRVPELHRSDRLAEIPGSSNWTVVK
jgi:hypothetical protein